MNLFEYFGGHKPAGTLIQISRFAIEGSAPDDDPRRAAYMGRRCSIVEERCPRVSASGAQI